MLAILACAPACACSAGAAAGELRLRAEFAAGVPRADLVFIGTVVAMTRAGGRSIAPGEVTLDVTETLRGRTAARRNFAWHGASSSACDRYASFSDIDFRLGERVIVYARRGRLLRAALIDLPRDDTGLGLLEERRIVAQGRR